jgi:hypothetical protein
VAPLLFAGRRRAVGYGGAGEKSMDEDFLEIS